MTDFYKLFMVKMNKMTDKKTLASFLVVYIIYGSLVYTDSKKTVLFTTPDYQLHTIYPTLTGN